jgi:hypothetical protein
MLGNPIAPVAAFDRTSGLKFLTCDFWCAPSRQHETGMCLDYISGFGAALSCARPALTEPPTIIANP